MGSDHGATVVGLTRTNRNSPGCCGEAWAAWPDGRKFSAQTQKLGNDRIARRAPVWLTVAMREMWRRATKFQACGFRLQAAPDESGEKNEGAAKSAYI